MVVPVPSYRCSQVGIRPGVVLVSELCPLDLLPQNSALVLRRAPKRADPDQPTAFSLANVGGRNLNVCACFLGATWRGDQGLSYEVLWAFRRSFEHI